MATQSVVLDYGSGNVRSAVRALERVGAEVELTADPAAAIAADGLVVPGVGAFAACMAGLAGGAAQPDPRSSGCAAGRPVLGICVGMQVLFDAGIEHGVADRRPGPAAGPGRAAARAGGAAHGLEHRAPAGRLGAVRRPGTTTRFYFVHSYAVHPAPSRPAAG